MNLYTLKISKGGEIKFKPGFNFYRRSNSKLFKLNDQFFNRVLLKQDCKPVLRKYTALTGFLHIEHKFPTLYTDTYVGVSNRALIHIKARFRGVSVSPSDSNCIPLMRCSDPKKGFESWIFLVFTDQMIDIDIKGENSLRVTCNDVGEIKFEDLCLSE